MISTSTTKGIPWPVPWDKRAKIFFRAGSVIERADFEGEMVGEYNAPRTYDFQLAQEFAAGVNALLKDDPEGAAELIELDQAEAALRSEGGDPLSPKDAALLKGAREQLAQHWPPYKALMKQAKRRQQIVPALAFRWFCVGWEGTAFPKFECGPDGQVTLEALSKIDPLIVQVAGVFAYGLLYGGGEEKNSARPLQSDKGRKTSNSGTSTKGGSSTRRNGVRTRSSSSRHGRSPSSTSG